jgi:hypothetical protein
MTLESVAPLSDDPILACPSWPPDPPEITMARHRSYTTGWDTIRLQAENPLIVLVKFAKPALFQST